MTGRTVRVHVIYLNPARATLRPHRLDKSEGVPANSSTNSKQASLWTLTSYL